VTNVLNLAAYSNDADIYETLIYSDAYIVNLARKTIPRAIIPQEILDLEIDELAQSTRIKLWHALNRRTVTNVKSYIRRIVHNSCVDIAREHGRITSLVTDEEDEAYQGLLVAAGEGMQDPAYEIEREWMRRDSVERLVQCIVALPPRQRQAIICTLKDRVDDLFLLTKTFKDYGLDINQIQWPKEREELQRMRAALTTARQKLKCSSMKDLAVS
jgi:RNA polymerase sigma factor (sigma-70 family)